MAFKPIYTIDQAIRDRQPFWRCRQELPLGTLDTTVINAAVAGIAVGPDSDFGSYLVVADALSSPSALYQTNSFVFSSRAPMTYGIGAHITKDSNSASSFTGKLIIQPWDGINSSIYTD